MEKWTGFSIIECAKTINGVKDKHEYITRIVDSIGEDRKIGLIRIIDEISKEQDAWSVMTKDVSDWLKKKRNEYNL